MEFESRFISTKVDIEERTDERGIRRPVIRGTASVVYDGTPGTEYQLTDGVFERFSAGAFDGYLATNPEILCFYNHDRNKLLARTPDSLKVWADSRGLHYEAMLDDTSYAQDLKVLLRNGKIKGSSFAFVPRQVEWVKENGREIRLVREAIVDEVSPVVQPAFGATAAKYALRERQAWHDQEQTERREARLAEIMKAVG